MNFTRTGLLALALLFGLHVSAQGFTEVSIASGMNHMFRSQMKMGGGAAFFDYDADGDEDAFLTGGLSPSRLYRNEGNGQFTDQSAAAGIGVIGSSHTMGVATGDIDNDGYREIFITTMDGEPNRLLYNNGDGTFTDITMSAGIGADTSWSCSAAFGDYDRDGDLDIFVCNYLYDQTVLYDTAGDPIGFRPDGLPDYLFRNEGNLTFTEVAVAEQVADSGCGLAVTFTDYDKDWGMDILVANDHGMWDSPNSLFRNVGGQPCFSDVSAATGMDARMYGMGIAVGDYDQDHDLDYYITDIGPNKLFRNDGSPGFTEVAIPTGVVSDSLNGLNTTGWGTAWIDYDNDSWLDLFEANGHISVLPFIANVTRDPDKFYRNNGPGQPFTDVTVAMGVGDSGMSRGMITGDYDNDGDEDLLVMSIHHDTASGVHTLLYRNDVPNNHHWMQLQLQGTISNRDAFGAQVEVSFPGTLQGWTHEVSGGASHMSHSSSIVHLGLGTNTTSPEIMVRWPRGGLQRYTGLALDQRHLLVEDSSQFLVTTPSPATQHMTIAPNPNAGSFAIQLEGFAGEAVELRAVDVLGRVRILHAGLAQERVDVQAGALAAGVYLVELRTANGRWVERMVVR